VTEICLRVHNEIHTVEKPVKRCLVKYFKWLPNVFKGQRAAKWQDLFFRPNHKGYIALLVQLFV